MEEVVAQGAYERYEPKDEYQERVVQIRRVTKVVKGGKQLSFRAVVVVGDENGSVRHPANPFFTFCLPHHCCSCSNLERPEECTYIHFSFPFSHKHFPFFCLLLLFL